jgi:glycopeptide antibiotics resistance protein
LTAPIRWGWLFWWIVWAVFAVPWTSVGTVAHWERVEWLPFYFMRPRDWLLNVAFFIPFGVLARYSRWRFPRAIGTAAFVALLVEIVQVFSPERAPATTDVITNIAGVALGMLLAR